MYSNKKKETLQKNIKCNSGQQLLLFFIYERLLFSRSYKNNPHDFQQRKLQSISEDGNEIQPLLGRLLYQSNYTVGL